MAVKHQLFIGGTTRKTLDFFDVVASDLPPPAVASVGGEWPRGRGPHECVPLAFDLSSVAPLPNLSPSRAVVSFLDSEGEVIKQARLKAWGTRELPTASLLRFRHQQRKEGVIETVAEAVVEFKTNSGTLTKWVSEAQRKYQDLEFKLLWVEWPGAQATGAHAYFPDRNERLSCPSPREIEQFVRFFGWVGDRGFNDSFFYVCPPAQSPKKF